MLAPLPVPSTNPSSAALEPAALGRVVIIANPISGRGRGARAAEELRAGLRRLGIEAEALSTSARGDVPRLLRSAGEGVGLVVAVGGDGTLSEVFQGLPDARIPVGLLPRGTANVLARTLKIPGEVSRAIECLVRARTQPIDVARVDGRLSHLVVGVGLDGAIVREVDAHRSGPITLWSYAGAALRALRRYRPVALSAILDGERFDGPCALVLVCNTPRYAGVLNLAPDARIDDGALEVYLFPTARIPELLAAGLRGLVSHLPGGAVALRRARSVRIEAAEPVPYQVDGDLGGTTPVAIELLPERYRLVVP